MQKLLFKNEKYPSDWLCNRDFCNKWRYCWSLVLTVFHHFRYLTMPLKLKWGCQLTEMTGEFDVIRAFSSCGPNNEVNRREHFISTLYSRIRFHLHICYFPMKKHVICIWHQCSTKRCYKPENIFTLLIVEADFMELSLLLRIQSFNDLNIFTFNGDTLYIGEYWTKNYNSIELQFL